MHRSGVREWRVAALAVFGGLFFQLEAGAKLSTPIKAVAPFPFSPPKTAQQLNYPKLPLEIADRIQGVRRTLPNVKSGSAFSQDWTLANIGFFDVFGAQAPGYSALKMESCGPEVVVAVIDTGIDYTHPDLVNHLWVNPGESGAWEPSQELKAKGYSCRDRSCNGIDDDGNGFIDDVVGWDFVHDVPLPYDTHGHGTHIAGIVAASSNAMGITGTGGDCPKVALMPLKYYDNSGAGYNNLANTVRAIQYATRNGAHIINYSGGGADPAASERAAVEESARRGVLFVAAAGNDGHDNDHVPYYPASYGLENIIGVASVNRANQLLPSSNFGRSVHVAAPGLMVLSTLPEGKYGTMSGTSQATAFVTGAAALLVSQMKLRHQNDFRKVKRWLLEGVRPLKGNERKTLLAAGLLSLPRSVALQKEEIKKTGPQTNPAPPAVAFRPGQNAGGK